MPLMWTGYVVNIFFTSINWLPTMTKLSAPKFLARLDLHKCLEEMARAYPGKQVIVMRALAQDDMVVLHCQQIWPEGLDYAGMDIFRRDANGKIGEHWDILHDMPKTSRCENGLF